MPGRLRAYADGLLAILRGTDERAVTQRGALIAFAIRVAGAGLAYLSQALLARWMGSFEYGIFVFVWVWVLVLGGLAPLGLSTACVRFVAEYRETGRLALLRGLLLGSRAMTVACATVMMFAALGLLHLFADSLTGYYWLPAFLILFCLPIYALVDVQEGICRGYSWITLALAPQYVLRPLLLLALLLGAGAIGYQLSAVTAAVCAVIAYWATGMLQLFLLERNVARDMPPGERAYDLRLWITTALPLLLVIGFELLLQNTDILVLSRYLEPQQVAVYFAALKTIGLMSFVHFAVGTAAGRHFSAYKAQGDGERLAEAVRDSVRWTFWPSLAGAVLLLALGRPLLWLFGPEFVEGYPVMFILVIGFLVRAAMGPAEYVLNMLGEQNRCAAVLSLAALTNVALNFALVPHFGIYGAASATAVSVGGASIAMLLVARARLGLDLFIGRRS
ncbi:MAG: lipopolysaccharide biosynthesis protein [Alphaproteobacteria bacterium]|nr:MAG: lipopolysaccharide biosynthesis protein [Alphaproteobacteria bacterium]